MDKTMAATLMREAAEGGYWGAQQILSSWHAEGDLVPRNDVEALAWLLVAARSEPRQLAGAIESLRGRLAPEERRRAEERSRDLAGKLPANPDNTFMLELFRYDELR